ncbi:RNase H domain-containing protein [Trichonephila clavipes]|nr:RNase H domain-containing protein [Trichonephila clavipes]
MVSFNLTISAVEPHYLSQCLHPAYDLGRVFFHPELPDHQIHLQWIPSHIDQEVNEIADSLVKAGAREFPQPSAPLTFLKIFSRTKHQNKTASITTPQSTIGINVLVLEALWLTVLQDKIKLFLPSFEVTIPNQ